MTPTLTSFVLTSPYGREISRSNIHHYDYCPCDTLPLYDRGAPFRNRSVPQDTTESSVDRKVR